jgi:hypothetical protein
MELVTSADSSDDTSWFQRAKRKVAVITVEKRIGNGDRGLVGPFEISKITPARG